MYISNDPKDCQDVHPKPSVTRGSPLQNDECCFKCVFRISRDVEQLCQRNSSQNEMTPTTEPLPSDQLNRETVLLALNQLESDVKKSQMNVVESLAQFKAKIAKTQATSGKKIGTFNDTVHNAAVLRNVH